MQDDLEGLRVGCEHDQVGKATVEGLRRLIGALLQLYHLTKEERVSVFAINRVIK